MKIIFYKNTKKVLLSFFLAILFGYASSAFAAGRIDYSGSGYTETVANDGTVSGRIDAYLDGDTFQDTDNDNVFDIGSEVTLGNIPAGLTASATLSASSEPTAWTSDTVTQSNPIYGIAYGNGVFVAVSPTGSNRIMYSTDGITWTYVTGTISTSRAWYGVTYGNGKFVVTGNSATNYAAYSTDGITWTGVTAPAGQWDNVVYGNGKFVAVSGTDIVNDVMYSTDGITWTGVNASSGLQWQDVTYGNGTFVAVSWTNTTNQIMYSNDGIIWNSVVSPQMNSWYGVTYGNGTFVAVAGSGTNRVMYSTNNGASWTLATAAQANNWYDITYGNGKFVAVSATGTNRVMYSTDGITWTSANSATANSWYRVTYGSGKYVAVSYDGVTTNIMRSTGVGTNDKIATFILSGNAVNHQNINDVSSITFQFDNSAFTTGPASSITNATGPYSSGLGIDFNDNPGNTISGTVYADEGITTIADGTQVKLLKNGVVVGTTVTSSGGYSFASVIIATSDVFTVYIDTGSSYGAVVFRASGTTNHTGINIYQNHLIVRHEDAGPITQADLDTGNPGTDPNLTNVYNDGATLSVDDGRELYIWPGDTFTPGSAIDIGTGGVEITATATLNSSTNAISVSGNFTNAGTFTHSGVFTLDGTNQTITSTAATTFATLSKTETTNDAVDSIITLAGNISISGALILDGLDTDDRINLVSNSGGTARTITFTGTSTFTGDFLDILDSTVSDSSSGITTPLDPTSSINSGNTTNWFSPPGYTVTPTVLTVLENGGTNTFNVVLSSQPSSDVIFSLTSSATGEVTVSPATLTFTSANWNIAQTVTVTGVNDTVDTSSNDTATVTVSVVDLSSDNAWDPLADQAVAVTATDDDTAGFTILVTDNLTGEDGSTGTFTIVMNTQPTANTTVALSSSDLLEGTVPASVTFTTANWSTPQTVTVTGVNDGVPISDGTVSYSIITGTVTSTDPVYGAMNGTTIADVAMQNQDNDAPGIIVTIIDNTTDEAGATARIQFSLLSQPAGGASVTIPLSSSDITEGTVGVASITIANANWNTPALNEVTITGVDDIIADGTIAYTLITGDPTSADAAYNSLTAANVADPVINNFDNDVAGVTLVESAGSTAVVEGGITDTITVVLNTQPTSTVTITLNPGTQVTLSSSVLTFTTLNWNTPQTVVITALDDVFVEGVHTQSISSIVSSVDSAYNSLTLPSVSVAITDNDAVSPDIDGDGILNANDPDMDGDGVNNIYDTDVDGDGILNTIDTDDDADGTLDGVDTVQPNDANGLGTSIDNDGDGILDALDVDLDGDGVINILDTDTDNDGVPNTLDTDDDGDGILDISDPTPTGLGTNTDYDGDGIPNVTDPDMDGDAIMNVYDSDIDGDGIVNGTDVDDDNDGILDGVDTVQPNDADGFGTVTDIDGDGIPNVTDPDMDGDGVLNTSDLDTDNDGIPNTTDTDDDNDGTVDGLDSTPTGYVTPVTSGGGGGGGSFIKKDYCPLVPGIQSSASACSPVALPPIVPTVPSKLTLIGGEEPNVPVEFSKYVCVRYLRSYIVFGRENNVEDVKKLQSFLNEMENEKLVEDGIYKQADFEAVKRFQLKYKDQILSPWGLGAPSGIVGKTTTAKINLLSCSKNRGCPYFKEYLKSGSFSLESVKVQDFLNVIYAPTSGYPTSGLPLKKSFDQIDVNMVKKFQTIYKDVVLKPWNLTNATGWWYQTTSKAANELMGCSVGNVPLEYPKAQTPGIFVLTNKTETETVYTYILNSGGNVGGVIRRYVEIFGKPEENTIVEIIDSNSNQAYTDSNIKLNVGKEVLVRISKSKF